MAKTPTPKPAAPPELSRRQQFAQTYQMAKKSDPAIGRWVAGAALAGIMVGFVVFWLIVGRSSTLGLILSIVGALMLGVLAGLVIFSRRAQRAVYGQMEGQAGAAAGALGLLKRGWHVDNAVAFNKQQDIVHRVVGPPGIVLVGEGNPGRLKGLLAAERKRHERVAVDAPVHEVICGNGEGQVPLAKLARTIQKMKRQVKPAEITDILARLRALDATRSNIPLPKGPMPTNLKGARQNMRGR
jgi:F0F1-type ATP synthase assembly protein I